MNTSRLKHDKKPWNDEEIKILTDRWLYTTAKELSLVLDRNIGAITNKAKRLNLRSNRHITSSKYSVNESFFSSPTLINSYVAGFLASDGHIGKNGIRIQWKQHIKDKNHLIKIKELMNFTGPIRDYCVDEKWRKNQYNFCNLIINSEQLVTDLNKNFNINRNDKLNHKQVLPNNLDLEQKLAFIIGFIDGDGCICCVKNSYLELSIIGDENIIGWISDFSKEFSTSKGKNITKQGRMFKFKLVKRKAEAFLQKCLTLTELKNIRLARKWDKAQKWIQSKSY